MNIHFLALATALALTSSGASALGLSGKHEAVVSEPTRELRFIDAGERAHLIESRLDPRSKRPTPAACASAPLIDGVARFKRDTVEFKADHALINGARREYTRLMTNLASLEYRRLCSL